MTVRQNHGFSYLEMLVVISVLMMVVAISVPFYQNTLTRVEEKNFFRLLEQDMLWLQSASITSIKKPKFVIFPDQNFYELFEGADKLIIRRSYPSSIKVTLETFKIPFYFSSSGVPSQPGTFTVSIGQQKFKVTFPFGKGRFYVTKQT